MQQSLWETILYELQTLVFLLVVVLVLAVIGCGLLGGAVYLIQLLRGYSG